MQQEAERTEEVYSDVHEHELELEVTAMAAETSDEACGCVGVRGNWQGCEHSMLCVDAATDRE